MRINRRTLWDIIDKIKLNTKKDKIKLTKITVRNHRKYLRPCRKVAHPSQKRKEKKSCTPKPNQDFTWRARPTRHTPQRIPERRRCHGPCRVRWCGPRSLSFLRTARVWSPPRVSSISFSISVTAAGDGVPASCRPTAPTNTHTRARDQRPSVDLEVIISNH
jgi:hypothetical protein